MQKKLLVLNGGLSELPLIKEAKAMGYHVVTTGNAPELIGHQFADEYIPADYSNKDLILNLVQENNINAIVSCANDFGVITSAYVSEKMGWKGHDTYENAVLLHQKDLFKTLIQDMGIRCPYSETFQSKKDALSYIKNAEYPLIVKATDLTGGKGILKAENHEQAVKAIDNAFYKSRSKHIVIEPFLTGVQQSIVTFIINKKVFVSTSNDTYSPINPYLIQSETIPAKGIEKIQEELYEIIESICEKLSLVDGILIVQYIIKDEKPYVIELMRRCPGNQYLTVAGIASGFPWENALIRAETGMELKDLKIQKPISKFTGHHGIMVDHNGKIEEYTIDPKIEKHIFKKIDILAPGESINDYLNERVAYIYYKYDSFEEMIDDVSHMNEYIQVKFI